MKCHEYVQEIDSPEDVLQAKLSRLHRKSPIYRCTSVVSVIFVDMCFWLPIISRFLATENIHFSLITQLCRFSSTLTCWHCTVLPRLVTVPGDCGMCTSTSVLVYLGIYLGSTVYCLLTSKWNCSTSSGKSALCCIHRKQQMFIYCL